MNLQHFFCCWRVHKGCVCINHVNVLEDSSRRRLQTKAEKVMNWVVVDELQHQQQEGRWTELQQEKKREKTKKQKWLLSFLNFVNELVSQEAPIYSFNVVATNKDR